MIVRVPNTIKLSTILMILFLAALICPSVSGSPTVHSQITMNATGNSTHQTAINAYIGNGEKSEILQKIQQSSTARNLAYQSAENLVVINGQRSLVTQSIQQDLSSNGIGKQVLINTVNGDGGGLSVRQLATSRGSASLLSQAQQNIIRLSGGSGNTVLQNANLFGFTDGSPGTEITQEQLNRIFWFNGASGESRQTYFADAIAAVVNRHQENSNIFA